MFAEIGEIFKAVPISGGKQVRCLKEDGHVFIYAPGRRKYGWRFTDQEFLKDYNIIPGRTKTEEWHKRLKRAVKCLNESGLSPDIKTVFEQCLTMTYDEHKELSKMYWSKKMDGELLKKWVAFRNKFPFAFGIDANGNEFIKSDYVYEISECRLKSMYFGKDINSSIKDELKEAISRKQAYRLSRIRTSYDVSVEYYPENNKGHYAEEYRGCGNGHYYLMLDHSTALWVEDD